MRRVVVLGILAAMVVVSAAAWADIIVVNKGGIVSMSNAGIGLQTSHLHQFNNIVAPPGGGLGFVSFQTGALISGSLAGGGIFSSSGSSFIIKSTSNKLPCHACILFNGAFTGNITWTLVSQHGGTKEFQLSGTITGQLFNGRTVTGTTVQDITTFNGQFQKGIGHLTLGNTQFTTPEPGTLTLLGTGLVGLGAFVRRRLVR